MVWTRWRYRRLARSVTDEIADYIRHGIDVVAVVGVGGSPSCGVSTTLALAPALEGLVGCPVGRLDRGTVNGVVAASARPGSGIFIQELQRALARRRITLAFIEHYPHPELR
jgi:hypothetical protein